VLAPERRKDQSTMTNYSWLWGSWLAHASSPWIDPVLALVAVVCGILVGGERQRREKPAGLRTLSLVCLGSAVFTMMSFAFTSTTGDSGRVAAQIVTGIGFLGAGVILHGHRIVSGVTTAAIIWVAAAIGMTAGAGYVFAALGLSILVNRLMVLIFLYETRWHPDLHDIDYVLQFNPHGGLTRIRLERVLVDYELTGAEIGWSEPAPQTGQLRIRMKVARVHLYELLAELADVTDVISIDQERLEKVAPTPST
jgi:putative Mg2+ transporter-C (MgtC) family protein